MSTPGLQHSRTRWTIFGVLLITLIFVRSWWIGPPDNRSILLIVSGDTAGWITPCGCTANQSGGLLRRGSYVDQFRPHVHVIVADAGGAPAGTSAYQKVKFEGILAGERQMGLDAHNLGGPEAELGALYLSDVMQRLQVPFLSANLRDEQRQLIAEPVRIIARGKQRVALVGVLSQRFARPGLHVDDPRDAVLQAATAVKGQYDTLVVLAYAPEEELKRLAAELPEADAIVGGPTGQAIKPQAVGKTIIAAATNKGKFLVNLWWGKQNQSDYAWTGSITEMDTRYQDSPEQEANVRLYLDELGKREFTAAKSGLAPYTAVASPDFRIVGNDACVLCHEQDCKHWSGTKHGQAWKTLVDKGSHVDSYCQQCHTTGFALPGGFASPKRTPALVNVGCESCHGPAAAHVQNPRKKTPFLAKDQCIRCHDHENSPKFEYAPYWERIKHGAPAMAASGGNR